MAGQGGWISLSSVRSATASTKPTRPWRSHGCVMPRGCGPGGRLAQRQNTSTWSGPAWRIPWPVRTSSAPRCASWWGRCAPGARHRRVVRTATRSGAHPRAHLIGESGLLPYGLLLLAEEEQLLGHHGLLVRAADGRGAAVSQTSPRSGGSGQAVGGASAVRPSPNRFRSCAAVTPPPAAKPMAERPRPIRLLGGTPASSSAARNGLRAGRRRSPLTT